MSTLTLVSCATLRVDVYDRPGVDFTQYRTYDWAPDDQLLTGDPALDDSRYFVKRLRAGLERRLNARGFERNQDTPDLLVHYHVSVTHPLWISGSDDREGYCFDCRPPYVFWPGTLIVDFIETRSNTLAWRGFVQGYLEGNLNDQAWMEKRLDATVARILSKLPRRLPS
jgi:hypothetical protein